MLSKVMNMNPHPLQMDTKLKFKNKKTHAGFQFQKHILLIVCIVHLEPLITVLYCFMAFYLLT